MKALNVEAGRLNGWIKSPDEAVEELGIDRECAERAFMSNLKVAMPLMLEAGQ
jgi:DNA-directed RNA polymerase subunit N (RpoN/RPB10)